MHGGGCRSVVEDVEPGERGVHVAVEVRRSTELRVSPVLYILQNSNHLFLTHTSNVSCILDREPELSLGPFCVTRSNPTHQLADPTRPNPNNWQWSSSQLNRKLWTSKSASLWSNCHAFADKTGSAIVANNPDYHRTQTLILTVRWIANSQRQCFDKSASKWQWSELSLAQILYLPGIRVFKRKRSFKLGLFFKLVN